MEQLPPAIAKTMPDLLKEVHLTRVGTLQRARLTMTNGDSFEFYHIPGFDLLPTTDGSNQAIGFSDAKPSHPYAYYEVHGYYGTSWIKPEFYTGIVLYNGTKCFHYQGRKVNALNQDDLDIPERKPTERKPPEAWLDCVTQLPLAVNIEGTQLDFVHNAAPAELILPPMFEAARQKLEKESKLLDAMSGK